MPTIPDRDEKLCVKYVSLSIAIALLACNTVYADVPACPAGSHAVGAKPPQGLEWKCVNRDGKEDGPWLTWYENGQLLSERHMKLGKEHGRQRSWWPNGQLMMEGVSVEGNRYQGFKYWSITGEPAELEIETQTVTQPLNANPTEQSTP